LAAAVTSVATYPTALTVNFALADVSVNLNTPLSSALTPCLVPFTLIAAPEIGLPAWSNTLPETAVCASADVTIKAEAQKLIRNFFIISIFLSMNLTCIFFNTIFVKLKTNIIFSKKLTNK
jgi:hypothetical protein